MSTGNKVIQDTMPLPVDHTGYAKSVPRGFATAAGLGQAAVICHKNELTLRKHCSAALADQRLFLSHLLAYPTSEGRVTLDQKSVV